MRRRPFIAGLAIATTVAGDCPRAWLATGARIVGYYLSRLRLERGAIQMSAAARIMVGTAAVAVRSSAGHAKRIPVDLSHCSAPPNVKGNG